MSAFNHNTKMNKRWRRAKNTGNRNMEQEERLKRSSLKFLLILASSLLRNVHLSSHRTGVGDSDKCLPVRHSYPESLGVASSTVVLILTK